jgi:hypothetical protein
MEWVLVCSKRKKNLEILCGILLLFLSKYLMLIAFGEDGLKLNLAWLLVVIKISDNSSNMNA